MKKGGANNEITKFTQRPKVQEKLIVVVVIEEKVFLTFILSVTVIIYCARFCTV